MLSPFPAETDYFGRPEHAWKLNLWVRDGTGLLTLDGPSVQTGPDRSRRIVGMIKAHPIVGRMLSKVESR